MKIFNPFAWYKQRAERKKRRTQIVEGVIEGYHELINEYCLIQEKKSNLSKSQRDFVSSRIHHLIDTGHLEVKSLE